MLKVLELFSGTGCQVQALNNIGIECVSTQCEIDKYAVNTYNQLHGETPNLGDISKVKVEDLKEGQFDLITYSSPCQDFSVAGLGRGGDKGSGTRSSLLFECEKIIRKVRPKYLLFENVKNLLSEKHVHNFMEWLKILEEMGYCNYYDVLNAKDFGIPQNRSRIFCVSILGKHVPYVFPQKQPLKLRLKDMLEDRTDEKYYIKKEISDKFKFNLKNKEISNSIRVGGKGSTDQKHAYDLVAVSCAMRGRYNENGKVEQQIELNSEQTANCITTAQKDSMIMQIGNLYETKNRDNPQRGRVYEPQGISPALNTCQGGGLQPHIVEPINTETDGTAHTIKSQYAKTSGANFTKQGTFAATGVIERLSKQAYETLEENKCKDGDVINPFNKKVVDDGICPTITTRPEGFKTANLVVVDESIHKCVAKYFEKEKVQIATTKKDIYNLKCTTNGFNDYRVGINISTPIMHSNTSATVLDNNFRIRKLTPRECWRLMGWKDEQFDKIKGISNSQLYKMAGNGIVVNVLEAIFTNMFLRKPTQQEQQNIVEKPTVQLEFDL